MKHPMRSTALLFGLFLAPGLLACVSGFDRNDPLVNGLRILGAAAHIDNGDGVDWADAEVGDTVTFSALVANPTGVPDVTVTWTCRVTSWSSRSTTMPCPGCTATVRLAPSPSTVVDTV